MDGTAHLVLSRLQFALTTMFHITWAATSVGLSALLGGDGGPVAQDRG